MSDDRTPVIVGVGRITDKGRPLDQLPGPMGLLEMAAERAFDDAGLLRAKAAGLDTIALVKCFRESTPNSPASLARRLGADKAQGWLMPDGGNGPQYLVNRYAEAIAKGENELVLIAGCEPKDSVRRLKKAGLPIDWSEGPDNEAEFLVPDAKMSNGYEQAHGVWLAATVYAMIENGLRHHYGRTIEDHQLAMGRLFARFSEVAAQTDGAWFPQRRTAEEIATPTADNRMVNWPYTKLMNAFNNVDQSAAILMTSLGKAKTWGVPADRIVYLHGCADAFEPMLISERQNYHACPAIRVMGEKALGMAGIGMDEIDHIDLYSCFPSAVEVACDELGIAADDPRPLTVTGGLPYHGGAGNNYVTTSIAAMVDKVRGAPGSKGLVTANGGYLTKHAAGIYSTDPSPAHDGSGWARENPAVYQAELDALPVPPVVKAAEGEAVVETYTVVFGRDGAPAAGILFGRLGDGSDPMAPRFVANTPKDPDLLTAMTREDFIGRSGAVTNADRLNVMRF
ncbi:MAG: acetyl-CoA acetyltransferase [Minwuia sp.]|uniref:acetyl-CoA acetyltransferase n=1 Tax=Minwuia sp. TaxID=2493630 RepID=UPI003A88F03F